MQKSTAGEFHCRQSLFGLFIRSGGDEQRGQWLRRSYNAANQNLVGAT
jgi:hypothetical protein